MTRFVPVTVLVVVLAASRLAGAQSTGGSGLPNSATIVFSHLQVSVDGDFVETEQNSTDRLHYFNLAHCNCAKLGSGTEKTFKYLVQETAQSGLHVPVDFWVGNACATDANRTSNPPMCKRVATLGDLDADLYPGGSYIDFNIFDVINGSLHAGEPCQQLETAFPIYALVSTTGSADTYDYQTSQNAGTVQGENGGNGVDTKPPPLPTGIKAVGGESGIRLSWTPPTSNNTDIAYYQALCATVDDLPARSRDQEPQYVTTASLCAPADNAKDPDLVASDIAASETDAAVTAPTGDFGALKDTFICGHTDSGTASSLSIGGLKNGQPYKVILLSIDRYGNYTGTYLTSTVTPIPSTDFWEDLQERNSKVEGGLCLLAETYGDDSSLTHALRSFRDDTLRGSGAGRWLADAYYATLGTLGGLVHGSVVRRAIAGVVLAPVVVVALAWHALGLPVLALLVALAWLWRRRALPRWLVRTAPALAALAIATPARAGGYQPYWENSDITADENAAPDDPDLVKWNVGLKLGPYVPQIDAHFAAKPGPYEAMFGGYHMLVLVDVERVIWSGFGQVTVGASAGYWQKTARAYTIDGMPGDPTRPRASDTNKFRLIPTALTVGYRFTMLDDEYGIPVVPYVRGGLSYYVWSIQQADGSFASACKDGSDAEGCDTTKGLGASLGVQGAIGVAIRAERIDASAATSMRQSGIQHAGIFGELSMAKVDGFGSEKKLSVGDRTWFAGVNFEF
jgi:hypothetical protein